jgi:sodium/potassium-transporting ATPase subunit alpha
MIGEGINDSPALKKADVGIALAKGSGLARDSADMILLDNDFRNVFKAIKQGRLQFDVFRRLIKYNLTSHMAQLMPTIGFVILQFPIPFTAILILCYEIINILPNMCMAYEEPNEHMMDKKPRNPKKETLCQWRLISYSYLFAGIIQASACMLTYFIVLNDYGLHPSEILFLSAKPGVLPARNDVYNFYDEEYGGNTNAFIRDNAYLFGMNGEAYNLFVDNLYTVIDYSDDQFVSMDLRLFYYYEESTYWLTCGYNSRGSRYDDYVCYRPEALRHAQSAYLTALVLMQIINSICVRIKSSNLTKYRFKNMYLNISYLVQVLVLILFLYIPRLNEWIGLRGIRAEHWIPCLLMFVLFFIYEEINKYLMRHVKRPDGNPSWFSVCYSY